MVHIWPPWQHPVCESYQAENGSKLSGRSLVIVKTMSRPGRMVPASTLYKQHLHKVHKLLRRSTVWSSPSSMKSLVPADQNHFTILGIPPILELKRTRSTVKKLRVHLVPVGSKGLNLSAAKPSWHHPSEAIRSPAVEARLSSAARRHGASLHYARENWLHHWLTGTRSPKCSCINVNRDIGNPKLQSISSTLIKSLGILRAQQSARSHLLPSLAISCHLMWASRVAAPRFVGQGINGSSMEPALWSLAAPRKAPPDTLTQRHLFKRAAKRTKWTKGCWSSRNAARFPAGC